LSLSRPIAALLLLCAAAWGEQTGLLEGTVRDASQAVVPDALVSCIQDETGFRFTVNSNGKGEYRLSVPQGHYTIVARRSGFRAVAQMGVFVPAGGVHRIDFQLEPGSVAEVVNVSDSLVPSLTAESDGSVTVQPDRLRGLPQNDRTVTGLLSLVPGVLVTPANSGEPGQISSLGARSNTNSYVVDGISANNAVSSGGWPSYLAGTKLPAMTALGTTHDLALFDAISEVRLQPQGSTPEFGRAPGANIVIQTKSGTNDLHGSLFYNARPGAVEATDWFTNKFDLDHGPSRLNEEGGSLGGALRRDSTFFFLSAERLDLQQAYAWTTTVPSLAARLEALPSVQPLLNQFPAPNGPDLTSGISEYIGSSVRPSALQAVSARLDRALDPQTRAFLRIALTPSRTESGLTQIDSVDYLNAIGILGLTRYGVHWTIDARLGFSRTQAQSTYSSGSGEQGAGSFYSQFPSLAADFASVTVGGAGSVTVGEDGRNRQDQFQFSQAASFQTAHHQVKFGAEYLQIRPGRTGPVSNVNVAFSNPAGESWAVAPVWVTYSAFQASSARLHQVSGFVQDTWRLQPGLTATFGLRWLWAKPPCAVPDSNLYSVEENDGAVTYQPVLGGTPLWGGRPVLFDPTASIAWRLPGLGGAVVRSSWAVFHDASFAVATDQLNGSPYLSLRLPNGFPTGQLQQVQLGYGFESNLHIPESIRWDVSLQRDWSRRDSISIAYSGMSGRGLLRRETVSNPSPALGQLSFATNNGASSYNGLSAVYKRTLTQGLQGLLSYSWSHSIDTGSSDTALFLIAPGFSPAADRGASDFDIRHSLTGTLSYTTPAGTLPGSAGRFAGGWTMGAAVYGRTGFPVDIMQSETLNGFAVANLRPDVIPGVPFWIAAPDAPSGQMLNRAAFSTPAGNSGNLGRNVVRGLGMWQLDLSAERPFRVTEGLRLALRAETYNALNHPLFSDPWRYLSSPMFGESNSALNLMLGSGSPASGQSPAFQMGGPRAVQVSLRLSF
jgi:hypothetical protein